MDQPKLKKDLGIFAATAIVIGNTIGSGIFMSPQGLAHSSTPFFAMLAWIITSIGSILIALSFANLGSAFPTTGGPIVYTQRAFGDFAAFLIAWTYWIGGWVGNATIITGFVSYFTYFFPFVGENRLSAFLLSSFILWSFTVLNILGVKKAGIIGIVTTILKIIPLLIFCIIGVFYFNPSNFSTVSGQNAGGFSTLGAAIAITLWAFVGIESATLPAEEIKNPEKNIKLSTILGTLITAVIYLLVSTIAIGSMEQSKLAISKAPLADIINHITGSNFGGFFIALGAVISTLGATSGWVLTVARSAFAAGELKIFPKSFTAIHPKYRTPVFSLIVTGIFTNACLILNYVQSLTSAFNFLLLMATLAFLPSYSFSAASEILLLVKHSKDFSLINFVKSSYISLLAFIYSIYAISGTGAEVVMYGFILMLLGIPFYVYMEIKKRDEKSIA